MMLQVCVFIRPPDAQPAEQMSVLNKESLLQAARLEHMGKLTRTAQLLVWAQTALDLQSGAAARFQRLGGLSKLVCHFSTWFTAARTIHQISAPTAASLHILSLKK